MAIDWSDIYSPKVRDAFRVALADKQLTHGEVIDVLRKVLDDGNLSGVEVNDLQKIARTSETIPERSRYLLLNLAFEVNQALGYGPIYFSTTRQKYAAEILCDFLERNGPQRFPKLDRNRVGIDLLLRVANPNIINQQNAGLCGPVSFLYSLAFDSPAAYARYGIDLFENGKAKIGRIEVEPGSDCRNYAPQPPMSHGEWLTAGSLRDSENFLLDYDGVDRNWFSDGATNSEVARWFSKAGYTDVRAEDNMFSSRGASDIDLINKLYNDGYRIMLRINSKLLKPKQQADSSWKGNHFVILRSPIAVTGQEVRLTVYTWGWGQWDIPAPNTKMSPAGFREHWYGYVVAKPF
ncbi:hypothetical protein SAZ10_25900 [Mesorhizobium sp. BAC0120]|uniref:hypothetical protein n=1 Tax=Mesorhizobium sp. BAC0120 TaxID=3090670 RepID=UPI00298CCF2A|nr:hypothetical protein [Mesorhizobium sp. BAC0120]MDW6025198.1 hypothetical protein [Mesorhizobium sp. BAC0120]